MPSDKWHETLKHKGQENWMVFRNEMKHFYSFKTQMSALDKLQEEKKFFKFNQNLWYTRRKLLSKLIPLQFLVWKNLSTKTFLSENVCTKNILFLMKNFYT